MQLYEALRFDSGEGSDVVDMEASFLKSLYDTRVLEAQLEFEMKQVQQALRKASLLSDLHVAWRLPNKEKIKCMEL